MASVVIRNATIVGDLVGAGGGIWGPDDPRPQPPIVLPIPPDAIAPGVPAHPIYIPVYPAHPIVIPPGAIGPGVPAHPIYLPPVIWPSPGHPAHPIVLPPDAISPGVPAHPIYFPPTVWPPLDPPGIWPSPGHPSQGPGFPTAPIVLPPEKPTDPPTEPPTNPADPNWTWAWNPNTGWIPAFVPEGGKPRPIPNPPAPEQPQGRRS